MNESINAPSTAPETTGVMHGGTFNNQPVNAVNYEQSENITPAPENYTTEPDLPVKSDGPVPPPYNDSDKQAAPIASNNPYPGYDPSRIRIAVTPLERLGEVPAHINCPFCNTISLTTVQKTDSSQTTIAAVLCCLCCGIITVCLPSWLGWYQNVEHRCGNCKRRVAYKPNDGPIQIETGVAAQGQIQVPQEVHKAT